MLDKFISYLLAWVNHAIYVWGGQGETITSTAQIYRMETSKINALRAIALWVKRGRNAVCFDCSGLLVSWLLSAGLIKYDTTANGLLSRCWRINREQLRRGDWVFRVKDGKAYHVGVVVDSQLNVVESKGRDDGVVKRPPDATPGYWNVFGRPEMFKTEIEFSASGHIQNLGWQDGEQTIGTVGQSLRLEAVKIDLPGIEYRAHVQDLGWLDWVASGQVAGTTGESRRMEAIQIVGPVQYRAHVQDIGWMDWVNSGETAGTTGQSKRLEAIEIKML